MRAQTDGGLTWAYDDHDQNLPCLGWPNWDSLRTDPRFQALVRRVGLPQ